VPVDVLVIGAGVVGTAVARELSLLDVSVAVIERWHDVGEETSKANSGVTNCGWSLKPGSLEGQLVSASYPQWPQLTTDLGVEWRKVGITMLAFTDKEVEALPAWVERADRNGNEALLLEGDEIFEYAPHASPSTKMAVHIPEEAVVDSVRLTVAYGEQASLNGVRFYFCQPAVSAEHVDGVVSEVSTPHHTFRPRFIVNAAGLGADDVSRILGGEDFAVTPRRGQWALLDREFGSRVPGILTGVPGPLGHGPMVLPTAHGSVLLGPTAEDQGDKLDRTTDEANLNEVLARCTQMMPAIDMRFVTKRFAGVRANSDPTYRIGWSGSAGNVVHVAGIRSTGVSASPGIAQYVRDLLVEQGLSSTPKSDPVRVLDYRKPLWSGLDCAGAAADPLGRTVICACEKVTAGDIHQALSEPLPATSIIGVARRTHATWGRCQGSACLSGVSFITSMYTGHDPWEIPYHEPGSQIGVGATDD
jgi:glycerol-3-phosphate dehydrogenase